MESEALNYSWAGVCMCAWVSQKGRFLYGEMMLRIDSFLHAGFFLIYKFFDITGSDSNGANCRRRGIYLSI